MKYKSSLIDNSNISSNLSILVKEKKNIYIYRLILIENINGRGKCILSKIEEGEKHDDSCYDDDYEESGRRVGTIENQRQPVPRTGSSPPVS